MFSKQAADKLEEVFANLFQVSRQAGDHQRADKLSVNDPVKNKMIPLAKMTAFKLMAAEEQIKLLDILAICGPGITRVPVLGDTDTLRYLIHRSMLNEFIAGWKDPSPPTLKDLADDAAFRTLIYDAIAFVSRSATVGDAKAAMDSTAKCQDVIVTESGKRDEPVIGWLTNIDIGRLASI